MRFTATEARTVGAEINAAVAEVLARHGLKAGPHRVMYGDTLTYKVEISRPEIDENGFDRGSPHAREWLTLGGYEIRQAFGYDTEPPFTAEQALGCEFTSGGRRFRLTGMNSKARKFPLLGEEIGTGRTYKFQPGVLRTLKVGE